VTNRRRKSINALCNRKLAPSAAIAASYTGDDPKGQDMLIWPGLALRATTTNRAHDIKNALRFRVSTVDTENCTLTREAGEPVTLPLDQIPIFFRLVHSLTYDSSQSLTLFNGIRLTELDHPRMSLRRLIVGLRRSPTAADVQVE
jgi:hypothetical protein